MRQVQSQAHHMLLPILLNDGANFGDDLDGAVTHVLLLVVQHVVEEGEDGAADLLVAHLAKVLRDQGNQGCELVQKRLLDISELVRGELLECWQ